MNNEKKEPSKEETKALDLLKLILEKYPDPVGKILEAISYYISGHPEEIKAEARLSLTTTVGFIALMFLIVGITSWLAFTDKLSGDTVAFIFGTAFGSIITFLYKYLTPEEH